MTWSESADSEARTHGPQEHYRPLGSVRHHQAQHVTGPGTASQQGGAEPGGGEARWAGGSAPQPRSPFSWVELGRRLERTHYQQLGMNGEPNLKLN